MQFTYTTGVNRRNKWTFEVLVGDTDDTFRSILFCVCMEYGGSQHFPWWFCFTYDYP